MEILPFSSHHGVGVAQCEFDPSQEDVNGEKRTVKNGGFLVPIFSRFGADFFTVYADFSRFVRDINGEQKNISLSMSFFTVSFSRFPPSRPGASAEKKNEGAARFRARRLL